MEFVADFHIHSKYSRATSRQMDVPNLAKWARYKGINLLGTGDFTHHLWLQELKGNLQSKKGTGFYSHNDIDFILTAEISSIYSQNGKVYRVHNLLMAPSFEVVEEINRMLSTYGNIASDGRPILGMSCLKIAEELFKISDEIMLVPAHIWTPWFSVFGSNSGFNRLEDAFGKYTEKITALETGLSSDPAMNWMLSDLDKYSLISNSDSHSPSRLGREANVFSRELNYWEIKKALKEKDKDKFLYTIEFFPEEGKYHFDGHRNCKVNFSPDETKKHKGICPVCKRALTKGVLYRVRELADREPGFRPDSAIDYKSRVPFDEVISEVKGVGVKSKAVEKEYLDAIYNCGSEFNIMNRLSEEELTAKLPAKIAEGVKKVRAKDIKVIPGHDGEYGIIKVFGEDKAVGRVSQQMKLF